MTTGYLVFIDRASALARSRSEALSRGCRASDVTQLWYDCQPNPLLPAQWLLLLDDTRPPYAKATLPLAEQLQVLADPLVLSALNATVEVLPV
jgi:hypothetical protein